MTAEPTSSHNVPPSCEPNHAPAFHWNGLTRYGMATTNYQLYPGDRIYIQADHLVAFDNFLGKLLAPAERVFGVTLLGSRAVDAVTGQNNGNNNGGF